MTDRLIFILACLTFILAPAEGRPEVALLHHKTASGHFVIVGANKLQAMDLGYWAETIADKVADLLGLEPDWDNRLCRIVVINDEHPAGGDVTVTCGYDGQDLTQRLVIRNYERVAPARVHEALCRMLLNGYILERHFRAAQTTANQPREAPAWLAGGLARNLYPHHRHQNSARIYERWSRGELMPLAAFLRRADAVEPGEESNLDPAFCGLYVAWLLNHADKAELMDRLLCRIARGAAITPEWLAGEMINGGRIADLEEEWDQWVMRQKWIVFEPGVLTSSALQYFKAELLIYPGTFGMPLMSAGSGRPIAWSDLISMRRQDWVNEFCARKSMRIQKVALGRGKELQKAAALYERFINALRRGKNEKTLRSLLSQAESYLIELEKKVARRVDKVY